MKKKRGGSRMDAARNILNAPGADVLAAAVGVETPIRRKPARAAPSKQASDSLDVEGFDSEPRPGTAAAEKRWEVISARLRPSHLRWLKDESRRLAMESGSRREDHSEVIRNLIDREIAARRKDARGKP